MTEYKQFKDGDPLAQLRANQAILAARLAEVEEDLNGYHFEAIHIRLNAIEKMLCQGHEPGVVCLICERRYTERLPDPDPVTEVVTMCPHGLDAADCPEHEPPCPFCGGEDCAGQVEPPGCPACDGVAGTACRCPDPVPRWRQMVDESARTDAGMKRPLGHVLSLLSRIEYEAEAEGSLARIIAVAEAQVGDGWQADPDSIRTDHQCDMTCLIESLWKVQRDGVWYSLGNTSARMLRDLTDGAQ